MPAQSGSGEGCLRGSRQLLSCCALTWWMGRGSFWGLFMRALIDGVSALMTSLPPKGPPPNTSACGQYTLLEGHKHSVSSLQLAQPKTGLGPIHSAVLVPPNHSRSEFGHWNPDPSVPRPPLPTPTTLPTQGFTLVPPLDGEHFAKCSTCLSGDFCTGVHAD